MPADSPHDRTDSADGVDPQLVALARTVDRTGRRLSVLDKLVGQLATDLTALARIVTSSPATPSSTEGETDAVPAVRSWLLADDLDQAATDLADLCTWLGRVYLRYPRTDLPSCWLWHPHAVEELWWLRRAHADAYHPENGSWLRVGDWHDRQLPGVTQRLAHTIGSCELALHLPGQRAAGLPRPVPFADAAPFVAQTWTGSAGREPGPPPTGHQLDEADRLQRDRFTS
ncbi:hypothetical protein [Pseudonocardia charpentierae]|uniref:DUF4913 domain-containing protein n=1 Tax=Pseudonocardia charpentierae TaxID=3075545 RepID=A0ABU2N2L9_9PSEU|nr:hypothetical protein [Pseudonocardia sp. DSM 45834]MDT0348135.1 hypothetical protein [Pseudonocardia sp. DSM 45834]